MTTIQLLILGFVLLLLTRTVMQMRRGHISRSEFVGWTFVWVALGVVAVLPQTTEIAARFVGVGRGADFAVYSSILLLFYLVFKLFVKHETTEQEVTRVVRAIALKDAGIDDIKK